MSEQLGDIRGRHVLLVDDILDSGGTIKTVRPLVEALGPASLKTCVMLRKDRPEAKQVAVDYVGFEIPDEFVVGYGLDYDDYYRNLPEIVTLKRQVSALKMELAGVKDSVTDRLAALEKAMSRSNVLQASFRPEAVR